MQFNCTYYDFKKDDFLNIEEVVISEGAEDLSFISMTPLEEETPVLIKCSKLCLSLEEYSLDLGKHAEVIECRKTSEHCDQGCYRIQVRYF
jgi:hypothetical protein